MRVGDYPVSGKPYWLTMTGVAALGLFGVVLMLAVQEARLTETLGRAWDAPAWFLRMPRLRRKGARGGARNRRWATHYRTPMATVA
jgi:hypothetical protein